MSNKLLDTDKLYQAYPKINEAIDNAENALYKSTNAVTTANAANAKSDDTQQQLNNIVINNGQSDAEVLQARGTYAVLNDRLNDTDAQLAEKAEKTAGGLDQLDLTSEFVTTLDSYIAIVNKLFAGDNGTRFYIIPKDAVTTGTGGALKIFGDPYHLNEVDYRDFGLYFHANQNGDTGANGTGVNWINSKTNGSYGGKNPDIGFSFQDGTFIGGRFVYLVNGGQGYPCFIAGEGVSEFLGLDNSMRAEIHGNMGVSAGKRIRWKNNAGTGFLDFWGDNATDTIKTSSPSTGGFSSFVGGTEKFAVKNIGIYANTPIIQNTYTASANNPTFDMSGYNRMKFAQTVATTITSITGTDGQRLTILFTNGNTTLQNGSVFKLKGGVNYTGAANETLVLERFDGVWQEISRSFNHA